MGQLSFNMNILKISTGPAYYSKFFSKFYFREPKRSMTHVSNIFTYKSNVQHLTLTKIN